MTEPEGLLNRLAESVRVPVTELKQYVLDELDEFLAAATPEEQISEFEDTLFALRCLAWAHAGVHLGPPLERVEEKLRQRLRTYATVRRMAPRYSDGRIADLPIGVLHFAFGRFGGQWQRFDALRNGTVAEISLLTDVSLDPAGRLANHCIITFADTAQIEYDVLHSATEMSGGNTIRCQIPSFLFARAKARNALGAYSAELTMQVLAALDGLNVSRDAIAHFHSWESGFLCGSPTLRERLNGFRTLFSPYLPIGRLGQVMSHHGHDGWTVSSDEVAPAAQFERQLSQMVDRVVLESDPDRRYFEQLAAPEKIDLRSFARVRAAEYESAPSDARRLTFLAGGRPVREKGFLELVYAFSAVRDWAEKNDVDARLAILCLEPGSDKGARYLDELRAAIQDRGLQHDVTLESKLPLERLLERIKSSAALIVPSLYDPYCLMPTYAVEVERPAFVSTGAGVSGNITSREFLFSPEIEADLARAVANWHRARPAFRFDAKFPDYREIYWPTGD